MNALELVQELVMAYGPPGQEDEVRDVVRAHLEFLGHQYTTDAKGNLIVGDIHATCRLLVTAHMDEIAMIVREIKPDGWLTVTCLGGMKPWKLGETPVEILGSVIIPGVLGFGGIHTEDPAAVSVQARDRAVDWTMASVFTGRSPEELAEAGVRPGARVVVPKSRRSLWTVGEHVAGYFLDDRADLAAWLLCLQELDSMPKGVVFAATTSEEVGGEGAQYLMQRLKPDVCLALELAPVAPDAPLRLDDSPALWVNDGYAASSPKDNAMVAQVAAEMGIDLQYQALSRGGSDASCAANRGFCARPITLGIPMENSHGFEIMSQGAVNVLARLATALVRKA